MNTLLQQLASLCSSPLDQIIHVGVGLQFDVTDYSELHPAEVVLVEGDPEVAEELLARAEGVTGYRVNGSLVAKGSESVTFYRYNLSFLNAPLSIGELHNLYPRLRVLDSVELETTPFASLLDDFASPGTSSCLLMIDLPGQETALLSSLSRSQWDRFEWILVRSAQQALQPGSASITETRSLLEEECYCVTGEDLADPVWPCLLFRRDHARLRIRIQMEERDRLVLELTQEKSQLTETNLKLEAELSPLRAAFEDRERCFAERSAKIHELGQRVAALEGESAVQQSELENRARLLTEKAVQMHQQEGRVAKLERQHAESSERAASLEANLAAQKTLMEVLTKGRIQQDHFTKELSQERDDLLGKIEELNALVEELKSQLAGHEERSRQIDSEFQKVEGQIDLIKEIFLGERSK